MVSVHVAANTGTVFRSIARSSKEAITIALLVMMDSLSEADDISVCIIDTDSIQCAKFYFKISTAQILAQAAVQGESWAVSCTVP